MTKKICDWWGEKHCFSRILNKCYFNRILGSGKSIWGLPVAVCSGPLFSYIHLATRVGLFPRSAFVCSVTLECFSLAAHFMFSNVYLHPGTDPDFFWGGRRQSAYEWLAPPTWLNFLLSLAHPPGHAHVNFKGKTPKCIVPLARLAQSMCEGQTGSGYAVAALSKYSAARHGANVYTTIGNPPGVLQNFLFFFLFALTC